MKVKRVKEKPGSSKWRNRRNTGMRGKVHKLKKETAERQTKTDKNLFRVQGRPRCHYYRSHEASSVVATSYEHPAPLYSNKHVSLLCVFLEENFLTCKDALLACSFRLLQNQAWVIFHHFVDCGNKGWKIVIQVDDTRCKHVNGCWLWNNTCPPLFATSIV